MKEVIKEMMHEASETEIHKLANELARVTADMEQIDK